MLVGMQYFLSFYNSEILEFLAIGIMINCSTFRQALRGNKRPTERSVVQKLASVCTYFVHWASSMLFLLNSEGPFYSLGWAVNYPPHLYL